MECAVCHVEKLANEFPPETVTDACEHPALYCLRCTIRLVKESSVCPHPGCTQPATLDDQNLKWFQAILDTMFREYKATSPPEPDPDVLAGGKLTITLLTGETMQCTIRLVKESSVCPHPGCTQPATLDDQNLKWFQAILDTMFREYKATSPPEPDPDVLAGGKLTITLLTGETMQVKYSAGLTVWQLKQTIQQRMKHDPVQQKLLYQEKELPDDTSDGGLTRLCDVGVPPNSTLCLVIILYSIPEEFDHVVFDLHWGYPATGKDYLDASCLLFTGQSLVNICDYSHRQCTSTDAIRHSGDMMDSQNRIGHHTINVRLKQIPHQITHLFFTLSAWNSLNISKYPNPSLKFYEAARPGKDLCKTTFTHAGFSEAVIMCSMSRGADSRWKIYESGKLSEGNANNYYPLQNTVRSLIAQGF